MNAHTQELLTPEVISRMSRLDLIARQVVEGFITGLHKSPFHGFSAEFAEHRQYIPGDPMRYIDWKVFGRSDRLYIKRFAEETNLAGHIILDASGSMDFQESGVITKWRYAAVTAASLAFLMLKQRDSAGLVTFSDHMRSYIPPRSVQSQITEILKELEHTEPDGATVTGEVLHTMAERIRSRGLIVFISDLHLGISELLGGLKHFRHNGHEVLVMQVIDPMERDFEFKDETRFIDLETGAKISTQPWHIRDRYRELFEEENREIVRALHDAGVDYTMLPTDIEFGRALTEYLGKRARLH